MSILIDLACGNWYTQILCVICRLEIPDLLYEKDLSSDEIASYTDSNGGAVYRLMRAIVSKGVFIQKGDLFGHNEISLMLMRNHPSCMYYYCRMRGSYYQYHSWDNLLYSIQTGKSALQHRLGMSMFEYLTRHPEEKIHFDSAMAGISRQVGMEIGKYHSNLFKNQSHVVDIGGGNGTLLDNIFRSSNMDLKGTVIDIERSQSFTDNENISFEKGSFFDDISVDGDIYVMKYILHDWGDKECIDILNALHPVLKKNNAKLYIIESIIPETNEASYHKLLDLQMMVCLDDGARERTYREYELLLKSSHLDITTVIQLNTLNLCIIICSLHM